MPRHTQPRAVVRKWLHVRAQLLRDHEIYSCHLEGIGYTAIIKKPGDVVISGRGYDAYDPWSAACKAVRQAIKSVTTRVGCVALGLVLCRSACAAAPSAENALPLAAIIAAIEQVESGGKVDALGDYAGDSNGNGRKDQDEFLAWGCLQIHPITVRDANRIARLRGLDDRFTLQDRFDRSKSHAMFRLITDHYSRNESDQVIARRWNGGPRGDRLQATQGYWRKVKAALETARTQ